MAAARGKNSNRNKTIVGIVVVVILAAAIIGGVLVTNNQKKAQQNAVIPVVPAPQHYQTKLVGGGVVLAGKSSAKIKLDFYEDFICPACGNFFKASDEDVVNALADGKIQVRFHMLNFLDKNSNPPGYSSRAANAALAAAAQGKFADYYNSLYKKQPSEGSAGYTNAQLISLGQRLKIGGNFADEVNNGKYVSAINGDFAKAQQDVGAFYQKKYQMPYFATPTVMYKGQALDVSPLANQATGAVQKTPWLQDLLKGKVDVVPKPRQ